MLRPSRRTVTRPTSFRTRRCLETEGCWRERASTIWLTVRSSKARNDRMSRRRGSATALKASEVVEARGMGRIYTHIGICQELFWRGIWRRFWPVLKVVPGMEKRRQACLRQAGRRTPKRELADAPRTLSRSGERFYQVVEKGLAIVEGLYGDAFIAPVEADVVAVDENALNAVGGNARNAKHSSIGGAHDHVGNDRHAGPNFASSLRVGSEKIGTKR